MRRAFLRRLQRVFIVVHLRNSTVIDVHAEKCVAVNVDNSM